MSHCYATNYLGVYHTLADRVVRLCPSPKYAFKNGEELIGRFHFSRETTGMIEVTATSGEILNGSFMTVGRPSFIAAYERTFPRGSIEVEGAGRSQYGNV